MTTVRLPHTASVGGMQLLGTAQRRPQRVLPVLPGGRIRQQLTVPGQPGRTEHAGVLCGAITPHPVLTDLDNRHEADPPAPPAPTAVKSVGLTPNGVVCSSLVMASEGAALGG